MNEPIDICGGSLHIVQWDRHSAVASQRAETLYDFCVAYAGFVVRNKRTRELNELRAHEGLVGYLITADLEKPLTKEEASAVEHRDEIEAIDARVGRFQSQFREMTNLLTELLERQMDLEALVREQAAMLSQYNEARLGSDAYGSDHTVVTLPSSHDTEVLLARTKELLERSVK